jgi:hypothetical protein
LACQLWSSEGIHSLPDTRALTDRRVSDEQELEIGRVRSFLCHYGEMISNGLVRRLEVLDSEVCASVKRFDDQL